MKVKVLFVIIVFATVISNCSPYSSPVPAVPSPTQVSPSATKVEPTTTPQPVTITFWEWFGGAWGDFFEQEAQLFHKQYPWITVVVTHYPDQKAYRETLALAFQSENAPDTFLRRHTFQQIFENKWAQPLDPWITPEWLAKFPAGSFVETKTVWNGEIYAFPHTANKFDRVLYINEDMFRVAGLVDQEGNITPPQTWSDLRSMASQITASGKGEYYGIGIGIKDPRVMSWWFDLANLAGAASTYELDYRTASYNTSTDPAFAEIIELLLGMKNDGSVYPNEGALDDSNMYSFFGQGKYAMFLSGSYAANNLKRDFPDFENYRIVPLPYPDDGRKGGMPFAIGSGGQFYMSSQTKHADEAWLWLDWISSRGFATRMVTTGLDFSVYTDLNIPENITNPKKWQAYEAITRNLVLLPSPLVRNPQTALVTPITVVPDVGDVLVGIYTGQIKDVLQALKDLDARKQAAFEEAIQKAQADGAKVSIQDYLFPDWDPMKDYVTQPNQ